MKKSSKDIISVQYGCGLSAPKEWINFDSSPTLRIQRLPVIGRLLRRYLNVSFPDNVFWGDIVKGLPIENNTCDGVYCSHVLEHLSLSDFRKAIKNTFLIMKKGATFRCIVPDLEYAARKYIDGIENNNHSASIEFLGRNTILGIEKRPRGLKGILKLFFSNSRHLWMWDSLSLENELLKAGFRDIRRCKFNDSDDEKFFAVEDISRFENAIAIDCKK